MSDAIYFTCVAALLCAVFVVLPRVILSETSSLEWQPYRSFFGSFRMRRKVNGKWQYREPDANEAHEQNNAEVW